MTLKRISWFAALVLVLPPGAAPVHAQSCDDCPGSSYAPCHYNFPLLWKACARISSHWHATPEPPPPFSTSTYEYHSHCPYAAPAALLGFSSLTQRAKLDTGIGAGR